MVKYLACAINDRGTYGHSLVGFGDGPVHVIEYHGDGEFVFSHTLRGQDGAFFEALGLVLYRGTLILGQPVGMGFADVDDEEVDLVPIRHVQAFEVGGSTGEGRSSVAGHDQANRFFAPLGSEMEGPVRID